MLNETGILLLAIGHPYYGRMAYNLAMSLKACNSSTHITLAYTESAIAHINQRNMRVFDNKMCIADNDKPFGVKLQLYDLSPYRRTIYMDVDTLWINKQGPLVLFDSLNGVSFTGITEGMHDYKDSTKSDPSKYYYFWADVDEIYKVHDGDFWLQEKSKIIYQWRSEFLYFEKNGLTVDLFNHAKEIYNNPNLKSIKNFADHTPDELAINIACAINGVHPHKYKWQPTYWDRLNGGNMLSIDELQSKYYAISCGSNASGGALKRIYNRICTASAYKLGLQHVFPLVSKKEMLTNRQVM